jgi:prepilin-type N-terminal cleavage/methylation domain-containing protein
MTSRTGTTSRSSRAARRGLTLLELILVMVIICTVLGMAAPSLRGFFSSRRTADAAAQIVALTQFARTQSATEGRVYRLNFDLDEGTYWLTRAEAGAFVELSTEFGREFSLPDGTVAEWEDQPGTPVRDWIEFHPDGRAEAAVLCLTGRQEEVFKVVCETPAEGFRVVAPSEEDD